MLQAVIEVPPANSKLLAYFEAARTLSFLVLGVIFRSVAWICFSCHSLTGSFPIFQLVSWICLSKPPGSAFWCFVVMVVDKVLPGFLINPTRNFVFAIIGHSPDSAM